MLCVPSARHLFGTASLASSALSASAELLVNYYVSNTYCGCGCDTHIAVFRLGAKHILITSATWLAGWLAVCRHSRYCIKTTKPILKRFGPSGSPIIEAFGTPYADTKFQEEPIHRGRLIHGVGKIGDFRRKWPISRKRCEIRRW